MTDIFVYGTLTDPDRADSLLEEWSFGPDARLVGLRRVEGRYPTLVPGGSVEGRILQTDDVTTLDRYEGVSSGIYVRVNVPYADGFDDAGDATDDDGREGAAVYVGDPDRLAVDTEARWPESDDFGGGVRRYVADERVVVSRGENVSDA
ncbi:Gamma-glutamyl cyclotransferase, AIG2-like [Halopelagius inordinatus]|uniref:Gamma-glutamyl cyclotransferase, AIG2-like n=1 Tax=Halopelagius inordinatus TaxID=553467 RepID=A0A1I2M9H0_9EURY|nr:gamma-glutamylcyclotransferase family protein [Halopelagius inordinatus]SFF86066.1 Gamma-glutamyl cyclotransferase, AIG2-like [Halopelagius inordinatus]